MLILRIFTLFFKEVLSYETFSHLAPLTFTAFNFVQFVKLTA